MSENDKENQLTQTSDHDDSQKGEVKLQHAQFSGPIPPPNIMAEYDNVLPGAAERILTMAENEAKHRHFKELHIIENDRVVVDGTLSERRVGQGLGFTIGMAAISAGLYAALNDAEIFGSIIGGGGVVGLVSVFVYGRKGKTE